MKIAAAVKSYALWGWN